MLKESLRMSGEFLEVLEESPGMSREFLGVSKESLRMSGELLEVLEESL
jgi:hypothetical protein